MKYTISEYPIIKFLIKQISCSRVHSAKLTISLHAHLGYVQTCVLGSKYNDKFAHKSHINIGDIMTQLFLHDGNIVGRTECT